MRRVHRLTPRTVPAGQTEAFAVCRRVRRLGRARWSSPTPTHHDHARVEQDIAESRNGHSPTYPRASLTAKHGPGRPAPVSPHNLTRAAAALAVARTPIPHYHPAHAVDSRPARIGHSADRRVLHLHAGRTRTRRTVPASPTRLSPMAVTTAPTGPTKPRRWKPAKQTGSSIMPQQLGAQTKKINYTAHST